MRVDAQDSFLLGTWIRDAKRKAKEVGGDPSNFVFNAKNQITLWGPHGEINDYSTRQWNGVVGDYQYVRWVEYLKTVAKCVFTNSTLDLGDYHERMMKFGLAWAQDDSKQYIEKAEGDFLKVGQFLLDHYFGQSKRFHYHTDMTGAPEGVYFTSLSRDVEVLSTLCLQDPWCEGFNSKGEMFHGLKMQREKGTSLYTLHSSLCSTNKLAGRTLHSTNCFDSSTPFMFMRTKNASICFVYSVSSTSTTAS